MTPEEKELRRALNARSGDPSPAFRSRLLSALDEGKPASKLWPALAAVAAVVLVVATIGVLLLARQARGVPPPVAAASPSASATTSVPGVLSKPRAPIALPANAQLSAPSATVVWALIVDQYLYRSTDRGATWQQMPLPPSQAFCPQAASPCPFPGQPEISFVTNQEGWLTVIGSSDTQCNRAAVTVWHTTNAGARWQSLPSKGIPDARCKNGLSFADSYRGFLDAWDANHPTVVYRTSDGGQTWTASAPLPYPPDYKPELGGVSMQAGAVHAFGSTLLVTAAGLQFSQYVFRSTDGGATWAYLASAPDREIPVAFVTANRWLQLVNIGQSIETSDAGASWHEYSSSYSQAAPIAADLAFGDSQVGYATVRGGISRTVDGGLHWTNLHTPGT